MRSISDAPKGLMLAITFVALVLIQCQSASASTLTQVSLTLSSPHPATSGVDYRLNVSSQASTPLQCITATVNTMSDGTGTTPSGFDASGASFSGSFMSSWSGWATANSVGQARVARAGATAPSASSNASLVISNLTNGTGASPFLLLRTYSDPSCTTLVDSATVAFNWTDATAVAAIIDPTFTFTVQPLNSGTCNGTPITGTGSTSTAISLGRVDKTSRAVGGQLLQVATNAGGGASVYARVDGPLNDGSGHTIAAFGGSNAAPADFTTPGNEAFGFTTSSPLQGANPTRFFGAGAKWATLDTTDQPVMYASGPVLPTDACVAFQITISPDTVGGAYATNITYTAVPSF